MSNIETKAARILSNYLDMGHAESIRFIRDYGAIPSAIINQESLNSEVAAIIVEGEMNDDNSEDTRYLVGARNRGIIRVEAELEYESLDLTTWKSDREADNFGLQGEIAEAIFLFNSAVMGRRIEKASEADVPRFKKLRSEVDGALISTWVERKYGPTDTYDYESVDAYDYESMLINDDDRKFAVEFHSNKWIVFSLDRLVALDEECDFSDRWHKVNGKTELGHSSSEEHDDLGD